VPGVRRPACPVAAPHFNRRRGPGPVAGSPHPSSAPRALATGEAPPPQRASVRVGDPGPARRVGRPLPAPPAGRNVVDAVSCQRLCQPWRNDQLSGPGPRPFTLIGKQSRRRLAVSSGGCRNRDRSDRLRPSTNPICVQRTITVGIFGNHETATNEGYMSTKQNHARDVAIQFPALQSRGFTQTPR
jgi:hypothetical protein